MIKWSVFGETGEFSRRKGSGRPINLFWSTTGKNVMIDYDVIMMSIPVEAPSGDETSEESDITLL